jgi:cytochrome c-type biogenesis protein CcmF
MTGEIGQLALCLALALALVQAASGLLGARREGAQPIASGAAMGLFVFVGLAFAALVTAFVTSDFSVVDVANNSHTLKPLIYKITGVWGNHEGSMLLWVLVLSVYSAAVALFGRGGARLTSAALGVQGLLAAAFLLFILLTSNPFLRVDPPPFEGLGLNPLLQDPGLAFHPPMLYTGYVGLSATFAYAAAALITGDADAGWARAARPFMLIAWIALTIGIAGGSWWAYYELGWGGFWFWDPVENASLMPWLVGTALLHSALATERTGAFRSWTLLLSIAAFSLSLIGTFLVRSGVLSSVHAFANDPARGVFILGMIGLAIGGALALFAWRAPKLQSGATFDAVSRETALLVNNVFLAAVTTAVFVGTLYPLLHRAMTGRDLSVGPPYYAITFAPIFFALLVLVPFGPRLGWQRGNLKEAARALMPAIAAAVVAGLAVLAFIAPRTLAGAGAFAVAAWLIVSSAIDIARRGRLSVIPASAFAAALAHAGLGVTLMGIAGTTLWRSEALEVLGTGESMTIAGYDLRFEGVSRTDGPNYQAMRATVDVIANGRTIAHMYPEQRVYPAEQQDTVETAIRTTGFQDIYLALGDQREGGRWVIRAYVNPLAPFIWLGGGVMALGGLASLWGRLRVYFRVAEPEPAAAE